MTFAERLAQARQESGLTQDALAGMLDVSRQTVSKWESGQAQPEAGRIAALADALLLGQVIHIPAYRDNRQANMLCDLLAGMRLVARRAQIGLDPRKRLALQAFGRRNRRGCRRLMPWGRAREHEPVQIPLADRPASNALAPAAKSVQGKPEPFIGKRLDQVVDCAQPQHGLGGLGVVCRSDHDHIGVDPLRPERLQQLGPAHLWHVDVQNNQVHRVAPQPEQSRMGSGKGLKHRKAAILLDIALVQPRDNGVVLNNNCGIQDILLFLQPGGRFADRNDK